MQPEIMFNCICASLGTRIISENHLLLVVYYHKCILLLFVRKRLSHLKSQLTIKYDILLELLLSQDTQTQCICECFCS